MEYFVLVHAAEIPLKCVSE